MNGPESRIFSLPAASQAGLYACFVLLLIAAAAPALIRLSPPRARWLALLWPVPYLIYAAGCNDFRWTALLRLAAIATPPLALYCLFPVRNPALLCWQDVPAWLWLALAILFRQLAGIWTVPANLDFMGRLFMIMIASWLWVWIRPVPGIGYRLAVTLRTLRVAGTNFILFAIIAIPSSLALHFTHWNPRWPGVAAFALEYIEIFVFIAWLEELFFRGFLQTLLSNTLKSPVRAQLIASCIFGLSHILNGHAPNWRYVALASVAGWFYGSAFRKGGNLMASSMTHALVDTVWRTWFLRP